jgi:hypothetical protein
MQFVTKNSSLIHFNITYGNKTIAHTCNTKFLGLTLNNALSWKSHIDTIIPKLSSATFAIRAAKPLFTPQFTEDGILFLLSLHNDLWTKILGEFPP